jgi:tungstate transport system substrate-binding protein
MKSAVISVVTLCCTFASPGAEKERLRLATTTSTQDSGLLDVLNPPFEKLTGVSVDVIAVGTGKALKLGENGDVDVVLVHERRAEDKFVEQGFGVNRRDVMHNDFVVVGPADDPAKIKDVKSAAEALKRIAVAGRVFVSRGDASGTNVKEIDLWAKAAIKPQGAWYKEVGQGMGTTLTMTSDLGAYTLSDRATFLAMQDKLKLRILFEGDPDLANPYGVIVINPARHHHAHYLAAMQYVAWLTSVPGQAIIRDFKVAGQPLFYPDAVR